MQTERTKDEQKAVDLAERVRGFGARASGEREVLQLCSAVIGLADKVRDLRTRPEAEAFEAACWRLALINNMIRDGVDGISLIVSEVSKPQSRSET